MHKQRGLIEGQTRDQARANLKPGNFQGRPPRGKSRAAEVAAMKAMDDNWFGSSRFKRRARVVANEPLTSTGTFLLRLEAVDGEPFDFAPGQFVGIEAHFDGRGYRRSPYCILSAPADAPRFDLLVRAVPEGPLSLYLSELQPDDEVLFRGPTGRPMAPRFNDRELVLMATGTGVAPLICLARHLLATGYPHPISLWWGLRLAEDVCLTDELDDLAATYDRFRYAITLSQPPAEWTGLRGGSAIRSHRCCRRSGASVTTWSATAPCSRRWGWLSPTWAWSSSRSTRSRTSIRSTSRTGRPSPSSASGSWRPICSPPTRRGGGRSSTSTATSKRPARARPATANPLAASDIFELLPAFLSHHPDQEDPAPTHVERPWNRPY